MITRKTLSKVTEGEIDDDKFSLSHINMIVHMIFIMFGYTYLS